MTKSKSRKGIRDKCHLENLNKEKLQELIDSDKDYSYAKFCPMLGLQRLTSNSKEKQLKELEAICEIEKNGTKYRFIRMRNEDEIILFNERVKYLPFIGNLLSEIILEKIERGECENGIYYLTTPQSLEILGMVNQNFLLFHNNSRKWEYKTSVAKNHRDDFSMKDINTFMTLTYSHILKPIIRDAFRSIDNQYGIVIQRAYKCFIKNDDGVMVRNFLATSKTGQKITTIAGKALEMIGIGSMDKLFLQKQSVIKEYYSICNIMCKEQLGYDKFCQCYAISINEERLNKIYNWSKWAMKKELNKRAVERIKSAKQLKDMPINSRDNLINAVIEIDTKYDFKKETEHE